MIATVRLIFEGFGSQVLLYWIIAGLCTLLWSFQGDKSLGGLWTTLWQKWSESLHWKISHVHRMQYCNSILYCIEQMSISLFHSQKNRFARKTEEQIPNPAIYFSNNCFMTHYFFSYKTTVINKLMIYLQ